MGAAQRIAKPESSKEISRIADAILRKADAYGRLPTPVEDILAAARVEDMSNAPGFLESFAAGIDERTRGFFASALQKIRGLADVRKKVIYTSPGKPPRVLFAKLHEAGHEIIPWHDPFPKRGDRFYQDDDFSLSPDTEELFDQEANYFAAEAMFQGSRFVHMARDYKPSMDAVFMLADRHGASRQATLRRYVEIHDEEIASITYLRSKYVLDKDGHPILQKPRIFMSPKFAKNVASVSVPETLGSDHPWAICCSSTDDVSEGEIRLRNGNETERFSYWAWWNTYTLLVLLRRAPLITRVRRAIGRQEIELARLP